MAISMTIFHYHHIIGRTQTKPNGLPYIIHDGIVNSQVYSVPDKQNLGDMIHREKLLSIAYYFTDNPQYASKAVELYSMKSYYW